MLRGEQVTAATSAQNQNLHRRRNNNVRGEVRQDEQVTVSASELQHVTFALQFYNLSHLFFLLLNIWYLFISWEESN